MINPKELRIGNYLNALLEVEPKKSLMIDQVKYFTEDTLYCNCSESPFDWYDPLPVAGEWLLEFGFELSVGKSYSSGKQVSFNIYTIEKLTFNSIQSQWWYNNAVLANQPQYIHQIQNLYFALTGKELNNQSHFFYNHY